VTKYRRLVGMARRIVQNRRELWIDGIGQSIDGDSMRRALRESDRACNARIAAAEVGITVHHALASWRWSGGFIWPGARRFGLVR